MGRFSRFLFAVFLMTEDFFIPPCGARDDVNCIDKLFHVEHFGFFSAAIRFKQ